MSRHRPTANTIALTLAMAASCSLASPLAAKSWRSDPTYLAWKASSSAAEKNAEAVWRNDLIDHLKIRLQPYKAGPDF